MLIGPDSAIEQAKRIIDAVRGEPSFWDAVMRS